MNNFEQDEIYNELDEYLNHQESKCEEELGEVYFAVMDELESRDRITA